MRKTWIVMLAGVVIVFPGFTAAQTEWVDDPAVPVLEPGDPGAWDGGNRYPVALIIVDGTYHMYFNAQPEGSPLLGDYDIGHATSTDGVTWVTDPANPVLTRGADGEWDDSSLWGVGLIHDDSGFRMWYSGGDGDLLRVGYATSTDGSVWTKHAGNPVMDVGPPGSFDDEGVVPSTVIFQGGSYRMWYMSSKNQAMGGEYDWRIGYAESADGLSWNRHPNPVLDPGSGWDNWLVYSPSVFFDDSGYHMWYTGNNGAHVSIGYALSSDGIEWSRYWDNPVVDLPGEFGAEQGNVLFDEDAGAYVMWYRQSSAGSMWRATSSCCSTVFASVIPAAAYAAGAEGSFYETDLDLSNAGTGDVDYRLVWLPRGESNTEPTESGLFTLGAGQGVRYANVLAEVFELEPDSFGALIIRASSPDLLAMARIANTPQDETGGTFGQAMPAIAIGDFIPRGERRRLLFGTEDAEMRFNVGCQSGSDTATQINFKLFDADGTLLGAEDLVLMPWSNDQLNRIFDPFHPVTGYVDFWTDVGRTQIYCYGSVLDNVTSDPTTVPPL